MRAEDYLGAPAAGLSAEDFLGPDPAKPGVTAKDLGLSLAKGVAQLPSAATSLADIPLALAFNADRPVSRAADTLGEVTGFQPKKWAEQLGAARSPGFQAQQQELSGAWDTSGANELSRALLDPSRHGELGALWDKLDGKTLAKTVAQNPGAVGAMTLESLPSMAAGGAIGRGVKAGAAAAGLEGLAADTATSAAIRAGIGEGAVTAGQVMDQIDPTVDPRTAAGASLAAGGITGLIGGASGRVAAKLGIPDLEMALAGAKTPGAKLSLLQRLPAAMAQEGILEELPQSMQEQVWQNAAEGKPLGEGVLRQGVEGMLAGMATGGAFGALPQGKADAVPATPAPSNADLNVANQDVESAMDAYLGPDVAGLLPDRGIPMPPPDGTLAAAAYTAQQTGASQADPTAQLLRAYPTPEAAQAELEQRPDADYLAIVPHPRADSGYAIVRKSPGEIAQIQQSAQEQGMREAANQESQVRQDQLAQEEEASRRESQTFKSVVDLNRNAAALEKSITEDTPAAQAATIRAQAAEMRTRADELLQQAKVERQARTEAAAKAATQQPAGAAADGTLAQAQANDTSQDELAPATPQPVSSMPAAQAAAARKAQAAQAQVQAANTAGQVRQEQLAQEETPTIDASARQANTAPSDKQKEAGNYAKGHVTVGGLQIAVENPEGSSRSGVEGGKKWTTRMRAHYGYVKRTTGADGDQVDVYVKPGTKTDHDGPVFVVDQYNPATGAFDEHKVLMGYGTQAEASKAYDAHFGDKSGPKRRGAVTQMALPAFKQWLRSGDTTAPVSSTKFGGQTSSEAEAAQEEIQQSGGRLSAKRGTEAYLREQAAESNARKQQVAKTGLRTRADHEATINATLGIDDAQVITEMSGANEAAPGEISKQQADFIRQVARLFKKKVVFFRSATKTAADGAWRTNGDVIYLNSTSSVAQLRVLGHELTHAMKVQAPEAFAKMQAALADLLTDAQLAAQHKDYFGTELTGDLDKPAQGTGDQTLRDFLTEEWMSDLSGNRFGEGKFWADLFSEIEARQGTAQAKGIVAKLRMAISNAINQLLQVIKGGKFSADGRLADRLEQVRAAVKDGFVAYEKAARAGQLQQVMQDRARQSAVRDKENTMSVVVGARPGEFDWNYTKGDALPAPIQHPTQKGPRIEKLGPAVQKILNTTGVKGLVRDLFGLQDLKIFPTMGSFKGVPEPSFVITSPGMTFEAADGLSRLLGFAFAQESTIVSQPVYSDTQDTWPGAYITNGKKLTAKEVEAVRRAAAEIGMDYTSSIDGTAFKFFMDENDHVEDFARKVRQIADAAGLKRFEDFGARSEFNGAKDYTQSGDGSGLPQVWVHEGGAGPSGLFRRTIDHLLVPYARAVAAEGYRFSPDLFAERFGLSDEQRELIRAALRPSNGKKLSTGPLVTGQETLAVDKSDTRSKTPRSNNTDVMWALQNRAAQNGQIEPGDYSPEAAKAIAEAIADEVTTHISRPGGKSAIGWYDGALKKAKSLYHKVFPELRTDPDHELLFDVLLGIASQGNDVHSNSVFAGRMYHLIAKEGLTIGQAEAELRGTFGGETRAIENNFLKLEALLDRNGFTRMREVFNRRMTVGEWNATLREDKDLHFKGKPLKMEGAARQSVTGWMVFGPKIGSFINNLHGDYSTLTADLWFSRTWNRILGFSFLHTPLQEAPKYQAFKEALIAEHTRDTGPKAVRGGKPIPWEHGHDIHFSDAELDDILASPEKMLALATDIEARYRTGVDFNGRKGRGYSTKSDLRRRAKNWIEHRVDSVAAPRNDNERAFQQQVMESAQKMVKRRTGETISIADMQAALWYHEKELFGMFGAGDVKAEPADYADAAQNFMDRYEAGDLFFVEKPSPRYIRGQKGDYLAKSEHSSRPVVKFSMQRPYGVGQDQEVNYGQQEAGTGGTLHRPGTEYEGRAGSLRGLDDSVAPRYGHGREGAVSVQGFHYSSTGRPSLSSRFYGTGMPGAEARRLDRLSATQEQRYRIHFYVDEGSGVNPEASVGSHLHAALLDNVYSIQVDPLRLREKARALFADPNDQFNWVEQQVMAEGFDGIYVPKAQGGQGVAVLLGSKHADVQVSYLGTQGRIGNGQALEEKPAPAYVAPQPPAPVAVSSEGPDRLGPFSSESIAKLTKGFWEKKGVSYSVTPEDGSFWLHKTAGASPKFSTSRASTLAIFEGLDSRGLKLRRAEEALAYHPAAATIRYIQDNILDILDALETSGVVTINC